MPPNRIDGIIPSVAKNSAKSSPRASSRAATNTPVETGRTPRIRASRRSGRAFSHSTIATSPAAIIANVSSTSRSVAMAGASVPG
jgi:hypothetical protein